MVVQGKSLLVKLMGVTPVNASDTKNHTPSLLPQTKTSDVFITTFQCMHKSCPLSIRTQDDEFGYSCHVTAEPSSTDPEQEK